MNWSEDRKHLLLSAVFRSNSCGTPGSPAVMVRLLEVLTAAASCLREPVALAELVRHAGMVYTDAFDQTPNSSDRLDLKTRHEKFQAVVRQADPLSWVRD